MIVSRTFPTRAWNEFHLYLMFILGSETRDPEHSCDDLLLVACFTCWRKTKWNNSSFCSLFDQFVNIIGNKFPIPYEKDAKNCICKWTIKVIYKTNLLLLLTLHMKHLFAKFFLLNGYVFTQIWKFKKKIATFFPAQPNWFGQGEAHV